MKAKDHPNNAPGVPMLMPPALESFQIRFINPIVKRLGRFMPGVAMISHRGRSSGKTYETAVSAVRVGDEIAIGLMHGKTNWVKNVLAAGTADIRVSGESLHLVEPRLVMKGDTDPALPAQVRKMASRVGVFVAKIA